MMKRLALLLLLCSAHAHADACASALVPTFTANQATKLCSSFLGNGSTYYSNPTRISAGSGAGELQIKGLTDAVTISGIGRSSSGEYQSLIEFRSKKTLVSSGNEVGRGTIRLIDNVASPVLPMEIGFYEFGAGLFVNDLFEFYSSGVSVRNFDGVSQPYIEIRDAADASSVRLRNTGTIGVLSATDGLAAIAVLPDNSTETWRFERVGAALEGALGSTLALDTGANGCKGTGTFAGTSAVTIATTCALTGSIPVISPSGDTSGASCWYTNIVNGVSFDVDCSGANTGTFSWHIIKETL